MQKLSIVAAAIAAVVTLAPIPVITGTAQAQPVLNHVVPNQTYPKPKRSTYKCSDDLGYLRRVYNDEIDQVQDEQRVWVRPLCLGEEVGPIRNAGNAGTLRIHIAQNEAMRAALFASNYTADEVVGVRMTGYDSVILFVTQFHKKR